MSVASQPTTSSLLATASMSASAGLPDFPVVARGYHRAEVEDWARNALRQIEALTRRVESFAGKAAASPEGQKLLSELLVIAADEVTGQKQAAEEEIAQMLDGAKEQAAQILADARTQADQVNSGATAQAASLVNGARADAKRTTDEAVAYAAAVHEAAGARLAHMTQLHQDGVARIRQMYDVTGQYLTAEGQRGPLEEEVSRALALPPQSR